MKNFKKSFTCDVCGKTITYPNFRIEWGYTKKPHTKNAAYDFIQVCHEDCCYVINDPSKYPCTIGDIIFDQCGYTAECTYERLDELAEENPALSLDIQNIKDEIFK